MKFFNKKNNKSIPFEAHAAMTESEAIGNATNEETYDDLGFGTTFNAQSRFIQPDGSFDVERQGVGWRGVSVYEWLVTTSWFNFFLLVLVFYILSNAIFAVLFLCVGVQSLSAVPDGHWIEDFAHTFFFSVQTFTTVGYGSMSPISWAANIIAALNALFGLMSFALGTGLFFARFSRPKAYIEFSDNALIAPYQPHINGFMFRTVNLRSNLLLDLEARIVLTWLDEEKGRAFRQFRALGLERKKIAMFPLNWTIVHPIDEKSPLYHKSAEDLEKMDVEFIIMLKAYDDTFAQHINVVHSYKFQQMVIGAKFERMYHVDEDGRTILEIDKINCFKRVALNEKEVVSDEKDLKSSSM
mgnify:CR=1 FL=1